MQSNTAPRHRRSSPARATAARMAASVGAAALVAVGAMTGATALTASSGSSTVAFADPIPGLGPLPLSCTGAPIDAYTACAIGGHSGPGGNAGDGTGADTPVLGGGSGGDKPPAG